MRSALPAETAAACLQYRAMFVRSRADSECQVEPLRSKRLPMSGTRLGCPPAHPANSTAVAAVASAAAALTERIRSGFAEAIAEPSIPEARRSPPTCATIRQATIATRLEERDGRSAHTRSHRETRRRRRTRRHGCGRGRLQARPASAGPQIAQVIFAAEPAS